MKLGISANQIKALRIKFAREHGEQRDAELAKYLSRLWKGARDTVRIPARQNGIVNPDQYVEGDAVKGVYAGSVMPHEPEAVPADFQIALSRKSRAEFNLLRADELERRELKQWSARINNVAKKIPTGTDMSSFVEKVKVAAQEGERLAAKAA